MTSKTIVKLSNSILALCLCDAPAFAHEFWLDPESSMATQGQEISANMRVGQDFLGQALPYLSNTVAAMNHWSLEGAAPIEARLGDRPAMQGISLDQPGLHRLTLETKPAYIVFDDLAEFADYLAYCNKGD